MITTSASFPTSERYIPINVSIGTVLSNKTYVSGKVVVLKPVSDDHPHQLRFTIAANYQANASASEYVSKASNKEEKWHFDINLTPSANTLTSSGQTLKETMGFAYDRMRRFLGVEIKVIADGLKVTAMKGRNVVLEATGSRTLWTEKAGAWTVFQGVLLLKGPLSHTPQIFISRTDSSEATQSSATPSWLGSDSSFPSPAGPVVRAQPQAGPSNYRPISSHLPPLLNLRPSHERSKRHRSSSPAKKPREAIPDLHEQPSKRANSAAKEVPLTFGPRTFDPPKRIDTSAVRRDSGNTDHPYLPPAPGPAPALAESAKPVPETSFAHHPACPSSPSANLVNIHPTNSVALVPRQPTILERVQSPKHSVTASARADSGGTSSRSVSPDKGRAMRRAALVDHGSPADQARAARAQAEERARVKARQSLEEQADVAARKREEGLALHRGVTVPEIQYRVIKDLRNGAISSVMGVVISIVPPSPPQGNRKGVSAPIENDVKVILTFSDYCMSVTVGDPTSYHEGGSSSVDLVVTIFRRTADELPSSLHPGMPILFRHLKLNSWNDKVKGNAYTAGSNTWAFVAENGVLKHEDVQRMNPAICQSEVDRLMDLREWWTQSVRSVQGAPAPGQDRSNLPVEAAPPQRVKLLGEAGHGQFFDTTFKILHIEKSRAVHFELYVTDGSISSLPLRNFHGVTAKGLHDRAIFCISIVNQPPASQLSMFQVGKYLHLGNVRAKFYKDELEMIWSEKCTEDQAARGWNTRQPTSVFGNDPTAEAIERRLADMARAMQDGTVPDRRMKRDTSDDSNIRPMARTPSGIDLAGQPLVSGPSTELASAAAGFRSTAALVPRLHPELATHLFTSYNDPLYHPVSTIASLLSNRTFPNRYRVKARVIAVHSRGMPGNATLVQKHCRHCKRAFNVKKLYCGSCQDDNMRHASWRYRFIAILQEQEDGPRLPILISDDEAEKFLPSLPPISNTSNPNDIKKTNRQIEETTAKVMGVLQGGMMDGVRPMPLIDWTLESTIVKAPKEYVRASGQVGIVVFRAFGMATP